MRCVESSEKQLFVEGLVSNIRYCLLCFLCTVVSNIVYCVVFLFVVVLCFIYPCCWFFLIVHSLVPLRYSLLLSIRLLSQSKDIDTCSSFLLGRYVRDQPLLRVRVRGKTQKNKKISNTDPKKKINWTQVLAYKSIGIATINRNINFIGIGYIKTNTPIL
jgi:hypothetical protein